MNIGTAEYLLYTKSNIHVHIDSEQEEKALPEKNMYSVYMYEGCSEIIETLCLFCFLIDFLDKTWYMH
jgi:hypothetical protein